MIDRIDSFIANIQATLDENASPEERAEIELQLLHSVITIALTNGCPEAVLRDTISHSIEMFFNDPAAMALLESLGETKQ